MLFFITSVSSLSYASDHDANDTQAIQYIRDNLALTKDEKDWLQAHQSIKIGIDAGYASYNFLDKENNFIGVAPDFISILSQALNLKFDPIPELSWPEIVDGAKDRSLDVIATAVYSKGTSLVGQ